MKAARLLKFLLSIALLAAVIIPAASPADASVLGFGTGSLHLGLPQSGYAGLTETEFALKGCHTPASQGIDGWVVTLPNSTRWMYGQASVAALSVDLNVSLYDSQCRFLKTYFLHTSPTVVDVGDAHWVVISAPYGAEISLAWKACDSGGCPSGK